MRTFSLIILMLLLLCLAENSAQSQSLYWISYANSFNGYAKFLMQIDGSGNVVRPPKMLMTPFELDPARTAIAMAHSGDGNILVWFAGKGGSIFRILINKQNMDVIETQKLNLHTGLIQSFAATQKVKDNFLALKTTGKGLRAFPIFLSGFPMLTERSIPISPNGIGSNNQGMARQQVGISSDGRMSFWIDTKYNPKLYVQPLDKNGKLHEGAKFITAVFNSPAGSFGGIDITNELPGKRRYVVYAFGPEDIGGTVPDHLFLQVIHSNTGEKIGGKIDLYNPQSDIFDSYAQNVAIDPLGRFVIFEDGHLFFRSLDSAGQRNGILKKLLSEKSIAGLDLLKEN